MQKRILQIK